VADFLSESTGERVPTLVVDSMQVYREIPVISNQARRRPAELVGIASVTDEWTVARHREAADAIIDETDGPFVLDAGTGMYLNAILLDIDLAPKVPQEIRERASRMAEGAVNPRREARARELEISGASARSSIWDAEPRYSATLLYIRPGRPRLGAAISRRSEKIAREGLEEARALLDLPLNPSVADSIGVRELMEHVKGTITLDEAQARISARTRRLARRQLRWFDKLVRYSSPDRTKILVMEDSSDTKYMHTLHDIMEG
jgi:tRNA dimethylallyltransferase